MERLKFIVLGFIIIVLTNCTPDTVPPTPIIGQNEFDLRIDFWNPLGFNPQIAFDDQNSSPEIKIDFTQTFTGIATPPSNTNVIIDNVRIIDANNVNYQILDITAFEWREEINNWKEDVEFTMSFGPVESLDLVLVMDASSSLGPDFNDVKTGAIQFVNNLFTSIPNIRIGIIDFSSVINTLPLTNNQNAINSYINNISMGPFTTLYQAMAEGIQMLEQSNAASKAMVTFTDGTDNNSLPLYTPQFIQFKLESDQYSTRINSFAVGYNGNGGVDVPVLNTFAVNGGFAIFPTTIYQLQQAFNSFSKAIALVYNFDYHRNQQIINASDPAKLRFIIQAKPK